MKPRQRYKFVYVGESACMQGGTPAGGRQRPQAETRSDCHRVLACLLCLTERVLNARADAGSGASSVSTDVSNDSAMMSCPGAASPLSLGSRNVSPEGAKPEPAVSQTPS